MPREGFRIEKSEVKNIINKEIEKHDVPISEKERQIIDNIAASYPPNTNTAHLLMWCNKKVSEELDKYPDLNEDVKEIRNEVGKELRFKLDTKRFNELKERIEIEKPEKVTPQWIRDRFYGLSLSIRRGYKKTDGSIDWDFIVNKLSIKEKFSIREKESWNADKEKIINALNNFLEEKKPIVFSPDWIDVYGHGIGHQIRYNFRTADDKPDWSTVKSLLNDKFKERFEINRWNVPILEVAENVIRTFELKKPKQISPSWIEKNLRNDYQIIKRRITNAYTKKPDWQSFLDLLPVDIVKCWTRIKPIEEIIPKNQYSNPEETDKIINKHKDKIYTFYEFFDKKNDRKYRDKIIEEMMEGVKKGNVDTLHRLTGHLVFMVERWIENDPNLEIWKYASEELRKTIENCIYRDEPQKAKFSTYLYSTLKSKALQLKKQSPGSNLKKVFADGKVEFHMDEEEKEE